VIAAGGFFLPACRREFFRLLEEGVRRLDPGDRLRRAAGRMNLLLVQAGTCRAGGHEIGAILPVRKAERMAQFMGRDARQRLVDAAWNLHQHRRLLHEDRVAVDEAAVHVHRAHVVDMEHPLRARIGPSQRQQRAGRHDTVVLMDGHAARFLLHDRLHPEMEARRVPDAVHLAEDTLDVHRRQPRVYRHDVRRTEQVDPHGRQPELLHRARVSDHGGMFAHPPRPQKRRHQHDDRQTRFRPSAHGCSHSLSLRGITGGVYPIRSRGCNPERPARWRKGL